VLAGRPEPKYSWRTGPILVRSFTSSKHSVTLITSANAAPSAAGACFKDAAHPGDDVVAPNKREIPIKRGHAGNKRPITELDGVDWTRQAGGPNVLASHLRCAHSSFYARFCDPSGRFLDLLDGHGCPSKYLVDGIQSRSIRPVNVLKKMVELRCEALQLTPNRHLRGIG